MARRRLVAGLLSALAVMAISACSTSQPSVQDMLSGAGDVNDTWQLTSGHGPQGEIDPPADDPVILTLSGGSISGSTNCSAYSATWAKSDIPGDLEVNGLSGGEVNCTNESMTLESSYLTALLDVTTLETAGSELIATGPQTELHFRPFQSVPPRALGKKWSFHNTYQGGSAVAAVPGGSQPWITIEPDGTLSGSTGCRNFSGSYELTQGSYVTQDFTTDPASCDNADLKNQDQRIVAVVARSFTISASDDVMFLTGRSGSQLVYRPPAG